MTRSRQLSRFSHATLTRVCAVWLVVLAALPFTAPFAALDLADLFGNERTRSVATTVSASVVSSPSQNDDADDVIASDACVQRSHPAGLCGLVLVVSPVASDPSRPPAALLRPAASLPPTYDDPVLVATLRV